MEGSAAARSIPDGVVPADAEAPPRRGLAALARTSYSVARSAAEKEEIYRLRYRAYLDEGAIEPNASGLLHDAYDLQPNHCSVAIRYDGRLVGALRLGVISARERRSSAGATFPDALAPYLDAGHFMVDPTRFVADPDLPERIPELPQLILRLPLVAGAHFGARYGLATPRAEHRAFYMRVLNGRSLRDPVPYPGLAKPVGLMISEIDAALDHVARRYPLMLPRPGEGEALFAGLDLRCPADRDAA